MTPTQSQKVIPQNYLYQGTTDDPPVPLHFENTRTTVVAASETSGTPTGHSKLQYCRRFFANLKLEIVAFLIIFSYVLTRISATAMILDKVCVVHFKYSREICKNLANHTDIKVEVEKVSTNYQLGHTLMQLAPAGLLSCFIGPWSDKYSRKLPMIVAIFGMALDTLGSTVCAHYLDSRVEYFLIPAAFTGFLGGLVTNMALVYSFASDMTLIGKRTVKFVFIEIAYGFAQPLGAATGGWMLHFFGYPSVFLLATAGFFVSLMCVIFLLPETRGLDSKDSWRKKTRKLFSCRTFKEGFIATAKERPQHGRTQIILLILSTCFILTATNSTNDINYLYVHHQFNWGPTKYSSVYAIYSICGICLLLIVVPILKHFKAGDPTLGLVGTTCLILKFIGVGLSWKPEIFYIAYSFGLLSSCAPLAVRSRISKVVSNEDLAKVFSFVATAESVLPVLTTVLISQVFNATLSVFPGTPYITLAVLLLFPLSVFSWLTCVPVGNSEDISKNSERTQDSYDSIDQ